MKVALCLHGNFNSNYDSTSKGIRGFNYIEKKIINKFKPDIYIHSWDVNKQNRILNLYKPKKFIIEPQIDFSKIIRKNRLTKLKNQPRPPETVLSHLYSVSKAINLCLESQIEYDLIIKARFDLGQINRQTTHPLISLYSFIRGNGWIYPVQCISFPNKILKNKLYVAFWEKFHEGPADMWYYGSKNVMTIFSQLYNSLEKEFNLHSEYFKYCEEVSKDETVISNAIFFYKYFLIKNKLWKKMIPLKTKWN